TTNNVFTDYTKNSLKPETTDYEIDQIANEIETISEEQNPQEKMMLLDEIKHAKQLSYARNLLQNGDFQDLISWTINNDVTVQTKNTVFKEYALQMPGARIIENTVFPTDLYQKIDESKLKSYTRYLVRGFIESSKDLEIYIKRYDKEIHNIMNVPNDLVFMNSYEQTHPYSSSYISNTNNNVCHCESNMISSTCQEPHAFSFPIDTGNLDFNENPGIQLLFKISNPDGYATLGNLEIIEERSLTEKEIQTVNEREQKWKQTKEKEQRETEQVYSQAQQAVQFLFKNNHMLQLETTMSDIVTADQLIDQIPYVYHEWFPHEPGINYTLYTDLKQQISQAYTLYQNRNFVQNGNFRYGTTNWNISPDATVQQIDNTSVLVIPNWSTQVSQQINLQSNQQYVVRVIAKKEGTGTGYITMSDCANHIQTLQFNTCGNINNTMCQSNLEYSTKTMYFTPHTNQVRIDIGETEGTFKISSIELLCVNS
ncbi:pesticidial crystal protein, partial [Bacillus thuringiensis]|uniref:pesticidial crystal protein n=1 Tax=Bacillus thuringiensis TaxID=1428 RepID=UPI002E178DB4|nr:pesticidial crystal protein [Bacillus thuringiensis]